jgi:hypothetical protein
MATEPAPLIHAAIELVPGGAEQALGDPATPWAQGGHVWVDAAADGLRVAMVELRFYDRANVAGVEQRQNAGPGGGAAPAATITLGLLPGLPARLSLPLATLDGQALFPRRTPGRLKAFSASRRLELDEIVRVTVAMRDGGDPAQRVRIAAGALQREAPEHPVPALPLVDRLGQWTGKDWPGRTPDEAAMVTALRAEAAAPAAAFPDGWTRWGGDAGMGFAASGRFRAERRDGRWWLVDPDGGGFFSAGMDCVRPESQAALDPGMERLLADPPPRDGAFAAAWTTSNLGQPAVDFPVANLVRTFGDGWKEAWQRLTTARLRAWRFNTIGNWSDVAAARASGLPYVIPMPGYPKTALRLFRDLPDVFDPAFAAAAATWAGHLAPFAGDPALIGWFLANEPHWAFGRFNLASEMLEDNPGSHSRRALAAWVSERYAGDVAAWSAAWGRRFAGFDELVSARHRRLAEASPRAAADLWEFSRLLAERFVAIPAQACKAVAPGHLCLGMRWAWISSDLCYAGAGEIDVFTLNCYQFVPPVEQVREIAARTGRPVLIGEWHMGALDRGLPCAGLKAVADQHERGVAYRRYLEACASDPDIVGCHWFQLNDQPLLGRFDGENFQIGFVDVCHRPYAETVTAARAAHEAMYRVRRGEIAPWATPAREIPTVGF